MGVVRVPVLFRAGGACFERYGVMCHRTTSIAHGGEELIETFTRADASTVASYTDRDGLIKRALADVLRPEWISINGVLRAHTLHEKSATNIVLWNRDLTNAAWVKTSVTAAKDQTGTDGTANSASKITATGANGTCLQAITLASSDRYQSAYVKRVTGSGVINMTLDNGATWTAITVTSAWSRVTIPGQTFTNPTVGFQIVTSGDAIAVDLVQNEGGLLYATTPIPTTTTALTRAADRLEFPFTAHPQAMTVYADFIERAQPNWAIVGAQSPRIAEIGASGGTDPRLILSKPAPDATYAITHRPVATSRTSTVALTPVYGDRIELRGLLNADGSVQIGAVKNGGAESLGSVSAVDPLVAAWSTPTLVNIGTLGANGKGDIALRSLIIAAGVQDLATMRAL